MMRRAKTVEAPGLSHASLKVTPDISVKMSMRSGADSNLKK